MAEAIKPGGGMPGYPGAPQDGTPTPAHRPGMPNTPQGRALVRRAAGFIADLATVCEKHEALLQEFASIDRAMHATVHLACGCCGVDILDGLGDGDERGALN